MKELTNKTVNRIVKVIVESVHPEKVILFGSRAREDHHQQSDYDFMVVKKGIKNERDVSKRIYRALFAKKIKQAVDVVVVGENKLRVKRDNPYLVYSWALKEGKVLYG